MKGKEWSRKGEEGLMTRWEFWTLVGLAMVAIGLLVANLVVFHG